MRAALFVTLGCSGLIPGLHSILAWGWTQALVEVGGLEVLVDLVLVLLVVVLVLVVLVVLVVLLVLVMMVTSPRCSWCT